MANRLINESSPYLLQHAHNPVDWYPWGEEALEKARREDKPILLSIGYSACHWCHVMERESFEDPAIARIMNENFVSIKVDREERPDLDAIYMNAVQAMTGHGGWPLTVFLTPDGRPFYGGTYFPPQDRQGMPGFPRVLLALADTYRTRRDDVARAAEQMHEQLQQMAQARAAAVQPLTASILQEAFRGLAGSFDATYGGFGRAPKFPQPMTGEFLLRYHRRAGDPQPLLMVGLTLERMARGGIYDHLAGGFHRYSVDAYWLVPHFEKMLYDNALLARLYLHAYQLTGRPLYRQIVEETIDYVLREMTDSDGGFYSAQDADSEGVEGRFYVWSADEIESLLGPQDAPIVSRYFGVTPQGNFEGHNILSIPREPEQVAAELGVSLDQLDETVRRGKARLLEARSQRVWPGRDDKVLTAWNGLMLSALAEAAVALGSERYLRAATANASFLLSALRLDGRVLRTYRNGQAKLKGYLEDYSFLIEGLLGLYEATFERRWLDAARSLADDMISLFWEPAQEVFYDTGSDHEALLVRPRDFFDNATPCGSSVAAGVLLRLAVFTGEPEYNRIGAAALRSARDLMARYPAGAGYWLSALDFYLSTAKEIVIVGRRDEQATQALLATAFTRYLPNRVVAGREPDDETAALGLPLLEGRGLVDGRPAAYVCENYACQQPVTEPEALAAQLDS